MADSDRCRRCASIADTRAVSVKGQPPLDLCHRCFEASVAAHGRGGAVLVEEPAQEKPQGRRRRGEPAQEAPAEPPEPEHPLPPDRVDALAGPPANEGA